MYFLFQSDPCGVEMNNDDDGDDTTQEYELWERCLDCMFPMLKAGRCLCHFPAAHNLRHSDKDLCEWLFMDLQVSYQRRLPSFQNP